MKKLLSILGAVGMTAVAGTAVVACTNENNKGENDAVDETVVPEIEVEKEITLKAGETVAVKIENYQDFQKMQVFKTTGLIKSTTIRGDKGNYYLIIETNDEVGEGSIDLLASFSKEANLWQGTKITVTTTMDAYDLSKVKLKTYDFLGWEASKKADDEVLAIIERDVTAYVVKTINEYFNHYLKKDVDYKLEGFDKLPKGDLTGKMFVIKIVAISDNAFNESQELITFGKL